MKTYEVVGETRFQGHAPGETFDADFTEDEERRFTERGSIRLAGGDAAVPPLTDEEHPESHDDGHHESSEEDD